MPNRYARIGHDAPFCAKNLQANGRPRRCSGASSRLDFPDDPVGSQEDQDEDHDHDDFRRHDCSRSNGLRAGGSSLAKVYVPPVSADQTQTRASGMPRSFQDKGARWVRKAIRALTQ